MITFTTEECPTCGIFYGVSPNYHAKRKEYKDTFYCPNGHPQSYRKSTSEILQEKLNEQARERNVLQEKLNKEIYEKNVLAQKNAELERTKIKKPIKKSRNKKIK